MSKPLPSVSILIPLYRVEQYVETCLRSVLEQDYPRLEVVIVDDASPDKSIEIAERLCTEANPKAHTFKLIRHSENRGAAIARQSASEVASGDLLLFLDSDDYLMRPDAVRLIADKMTSENADLVLFGWTELFRHRERTTIPFHFSDPVALSAAIISGKTPGYLCNKCYRRELFLTHAHFFEGCDMWEDIAVTAVYSYHAERIAYLDLSLYMYRRTNENALTYRLTPERLASMQHQVDFLEHYFEHKSDTHFSEALRRMRLSILHTELNHTNYDRYKAILATHPPLRDFLEADGGLAARMSLCSQRLYNMGLKRMGFALLRLKKVLLRLR